VNLGALADIEIWGRTQFAQSFFIHLTDGRLADCAVRAWIKSKKNNIPSFLLKKLLRAFGGQRRSPSLLSNGLALLALGYVG